MATYSRTYTIVVMRNQNGGYVVHCPSLPGIVTEGDTMEEAFAMAQDAVMGYLESLLKDGLPIPEELGVTIGSLSVNLTEIWSGRVQCTESH